MKALNYDFLEVPASMPRGNVTAQVTDLLRKALVTLQMRPGDPIDKLAICKRLGVSRFPVSEALARLQAEGLVDIQPQRGTSVSLIRIAEVREFMFIRKALEVEAVRVLVGNHTPEALARIRANLDAQQKAAEVNDQQRFHQLDFEFHELLFGGIYFARLRTIVENVRANIDRARRLILSPRRLALTAVEHEAIYAAVAANDAEGAARAMRAHIDAVMKELLAFAQAHPELFADGGDVETAQENDIFQV